MFSAACLNESAWAAVSTFSSLNFITYLPFYCCDVFPLLKLLSHVALKRWLIHDFSVLKNLSFFVVKLVHS